MLLETIVDPAQRVIEAMHICTLVEKWTQKYNSGVYKRPFNMSFKGYVCCPLTNARLPPLEEGVAGDRGKPRCSSKLTGLWRKKDECEGHAGDKTPTAADRAGLCDTPLLNGRCRPAAGPLHLR